MWTNVKLFLDYVSAGRVSIQLVRTGVNAKPGSKEILQQMHVKVKLSRIEPVFYDHTLVPVFLTLSL